MAPAGARGGAVIARLANLMPDLRPHLAISMARSRSLLRRRPLPPGELINLDVAERADRELLLNLNAAHGPIFKALSENRLTVCIVGLAPGRRLLRDHARALQPITLDLRTLFAQGFMRQMENDLHRAYRDALIQGLNGLDAKGYLGDLETIAASGLGAYAAEFEAEQGSPHAYLAALSKITSGMLIRLFFGCQPGSAPFQRLLDKYHALGPHGIVWNITEKQAKAYKTIRDELRAQADAEASAPGAAFKASLFGQLSERGAVDETMLGNLIYMVEMGRYDMRGLFRWISKYAAENPALTDRIAGAEADDPARALDFAKAFVLETLRMDQSERLMRNVKQDIVFDGFTIPKGAMVRICLWETHKDESAFPDPFTFDSSRFLPADRAVAGFSPFGLDHHHCPFSNISTTLAIAFLRVLARDYRVGAADSGPAIRGAYHWEPPRRFSVALRRRERTGQVSEKA